MKKTILLLVAIITISCKQAASPPATAAASPSATAAASPPVADKIVSASLVNVEHLTSAVDQGLNRVKVNDSTTILIYRGTESCTMIQLK